MNKKKLQKKNDIIARLNLFMYHLKNLPTKNGNFIIIFRACF